MNPPSIKLILLNRSTQYNKKASQAFGAMFDEIKVRARKLLEDEPAARGGQEEYFLDVPDTHSVAIVASHLGMPIRQIEVRSYQVFDKTPKVNSEPLKRYREAIAQVVALL